MKKYIIACCVALLAGVFGAYAYFNLGLFGLFAGDGPVQAKATQQGKTIYLDQGMGAQEFEIRGVDIGAGIPGYYATELGITKETYLRWFRQIQDLGANCIRVYTLLGQDFYEAVYEYNTNNPTPLYVIHGVWINDYVQDSHMSAYDTQFVDQFISDTKTIIDVIHGNRPFGLYTTAGMASYTRDISPWVIGYILGVEWEAPTVAYTNMTEPDRNSYSGAYLYTTEDASPFEAMLAHVGDEAFAYETTRYREQRLVAFSNWPTTDTFTYDSTFAGMFDKYANVNVEHIKPTDQVISGMFASYHIYPYYPDYLNYTTEAAEPDPDGDTNTYYAYLKKVADYHTLPVVISEYGVPSSRGAAQLDANTGRNQGNMSETDQGNAIIECYRDIKNAGCQGSILFSWQDEWFKRTWNTMANVDLQNTPYWSDYQTNEQYFGLLSFNPGADDCISYADGNDSEWNDADIVGESDGRTLSVKYDEKFIYLLVSGTSVNAATKLFIPIDTTQKSGSTTCDDPNLLFDRKADFLITIDGTENSRVTVQQRYDVFRATHLQQVTGEDPYVNVPAKDASTFTPIMLLLQTLDSAEAHSANPENAHYLSYETGKLTYGNANPSSSDYNSLADFCFGDGFVEIKIPWQLLNFSNPSQMAIHDDYYENYGVEFQQISCMYLGIGDAENTASSQSAIPLFKKDLQGWGHTVTYHERLKSSYYLLQAYWAALDSGQITTLTPTGGDAK